MLVTIATFLGGLGLFLLAVSMITDGLKIATGDALREILARSTGTRLRGILSGVTLTAMVQSSSAVTIATIGFVNAGLLGIPQALSIVIGATVGTAMTAWLVAVVGFQFSISNLAFVMIGVGMMARLLGPSRRVGAIGEALTGFGLFFIGIDILRGGFEGLAAGIDIAALSPTGLSGIALFVGFGIIMTVLTQSSSATIAITLSATAGGVIGFPAAAAIMIGAKIGTTSTSALAVIGATANAKRIAVGHVLINSFNGAIGLALLPVTSYILTVTGLIEQSTVIALALFYTVFNIIGAVLLQFWLTPMSNWLNKRFVSAVETFARPQYLDSNVLASPAIAMDAFLLELRRMATESRSFTKAVLSHEGPVSRSLRQQHDGLRRLVLEVERATSQLKSDRLHQSVADLIPEILRIANYIDEMVSDTLENAGENNDLEFLLNSSVRDTVLAYQTAVIDVIEEGAQASAELDAAALESSYQALRERWRRLKTSLLAASAQGEISLSRLNPAIDNLRNMLWVAERATRIAIRLKELAERIPHHDNETPETDTDSETEPETSTDENAIDEAHNVAP